MFNATDITGDKVRKGDVFVTSDRDTVTFAHVTGKSHDAKNGVTSVVTVNDTVDRNGPIGFGDIHTFILSDAETVSVVRL